MRAYRWIRLGLLFIYFILINEIFYEINFTSLYLTASKLSHASNSGFNRPWVRFLRKNISTGEVSESDAGMSLGLRDLLFFTFSLNSVQMKPGPHL